MLCAEAALSTAGEGWPSRARISRRRLLIVAAAAGVVGCEVSSGEQQATRTPREPSDPEPAPRPMRPQPQDPPEPELESEPGHVEPEREPDDGPAELAAAEPFEPDSADVYRTLKRRGGRIAQQLMTYDHDEDYITVLARALAPDAGDVDVLEELEQAALALYFEDANSVGAVRYAQLGGLHPHIDPRSCSVLVVCEQRIADREGERSLSRVLDVRLRLDSGTWRFEALASAGGDETERPSDLNEDAQAVLDDERIELPDTARWDIYAGRIDDRLLRTMLRMADHAPYCVTCLVEGHPERVFGTEQRSTHTAGRAVDIWAVDGELVVAGQPEQEGPVWELTEALFEDMEVGSMGSPWALDGYGGTSFSDPVHKDHLHIAFRAES